MSYGSIQNQHSYVSKYGDTMEGTLDLGGNTLTGLKAPVNDNDAVPYSMIVNQVMNGVLISETQITSYGPTTIPTPNFNNYSKIYLWSDAHANFTASTVNNFDFGSYFTIRSSYKNQNFSFNSCTGLLEEVPFNFIGDIATQGNINSGFIIEKIGSSHLLAVYPRQTTSNNGIYMMSTDTSITLTFTMTSPPSRASVTYSGTIYMYGILNL